MKSTIFATAFLSLFSQASIALCEAAAHPESLVANVSSLRDESKTYAFDGAYLIAASLMGAKWGWKRDDNRPPYWSETNSFTALLDYSLLSGSSEYNYLMKMVYDGSVNKGEKFFINEFYDDSGWWGLAWVRAFDLSSEPVYLDTARKIADHMSREGWVKDSCGGGMLWLRGKTYRATISTELYIKLLASLHRRIPGDTHYLELAKDAWNWFIKSGLITPEGVVVDGINDQCEAVGVPFSYNQGVILGAAAEMYLATSDDQYLELARKLVKPGMKYLSAENGIVFEPHRNSHEDCEKIKGDNTYFRGAYLRNLRELNLILKDDEITQFIAKTADFVWNQARSEYDAIASCWEKGTDSAYESARQTSALDLMNSTITHKLTNLALGKEVKTSAKSCQEKEGPQNLVDGSSASKWCAQLSSEGVSIDVDLKQEELVNRVRVSHAGSAALTGDDKRQNTRDFEILISGSSEGPWEEVARVIGNKASATSITVNRPARYVRLHISNAGADDKARIYELMVE